MTDTLTIADVAQAIERGDFDAVPNAEAELRYVFMRRQARLAQQRPPIPPKPRYITDVPVLFTRTEEWLDYAESHQLPGDVVAKDGICLHQAFMTAKGLVDHLGNEELRERLHQITRRLLAEVFKIDPDTLEDQP